jgi:hypothetical protein
MTHTILLAEFPSRIAASSNRVFGIRISGFAGDAGV